MRQQERGMTMIGLIFVAILVVFFGIVTVKVVPTVIEYQSINKAAQKAGHEANSINDVRTIYAKAMEIDQIISSVKPEDLDITPNGLGRFNVRFAYNKEIPLVANAYLLIKYEGGSKSASKTSHAADKF